MGVILDDLWDHEGYGARRLADGAHTGMWSLGSWRVKACRFRMKMANSAVRGEHLARCPG